MNGRKPEGQSTFVVFEGVGFVRWAVSVQRVENRFKVLLDVRDVYPNHAVRSLGAIAVIIFKEATVGSEPNITRLVYE